MKSICLLAMVTLAVGVCVSGSPHQLLAQPSNANRAKDITHTKVTRSVVLAGFWLLTAADESAIVVIAHGDPFVTGRFKEKDAGREFFLERGTTLNVKTGKLKGHVYKRHNAEMEKCTGKPVWKPEFEGTLFDEYDKGMQRGSMVILGLNDWEEWKYSSGNPKDCELVKRHPKDSLFRLKFISRTAPPPGRSRREKAQDRWNETKEAGYRGVLYFPEDHPMR